MSNRNPPAAKTSQPAMASWGGGADAGVQAPARGGRHQRGRGNHGGNSQMNHHHQQQNNSNNNSSSNNNNIHHYQNQGQHRNGNYNRNQNNQHYIQNQYHNQNVGQNAYNGQSAYQSPSQTFFLPATPQYPQNYNQNYNQNFNQNYNQNLGSYAASHIANQGFGYNYNQNMNMNMNMNMSPNQNFGYNPNPGFNPNLAQSTNIHGSYSPRVTGYMPAATAGQFGGTPQFLNGPPGPPAFNPYVQGYNGISPPPLQQQQQQQQPYGAVPMTGGPGGVGGGGAIGGAAGASPGGQPAAQLFTAHPTAQPVAQFVGQPAARPNGQFQTSPAARTPAQPVAQPAAQPAARLGVQPAGQPAARLDLAQRAAVQVVVDESPRPRASVKFRPAVSPTSPKTPSSTQSSQSTAPPTPSTPQFVAQALDDAGVQIPLTPAVPFRPPLPWYSHPQEPFPTRSARVKRTKSPVSRDENTVSLPPGRPDPASDRENSEIANARTQEALAADLIVQEHPATELAPSPRQSIMSIDASECSGDIVTPEVTPAASVTAAETVVPTVRSAAPAVAVVPALPKQASKPSSPEETKKQPEEVSPSDPKPEAAAAPGTVSTAASDAGGPEKDGASCAPSTPIRAPPTSWASLLRPASNPGPNGSAAGAGAVNGIASSGSVGAANGQGSFSQAHANGLGEAVRSFHVRTDAPLSLIEPRGLTNTGNMCYMNSVLQVLMYCPPFFNFLDQVRMRVAHSFKSATPMIESMILFMREYKVLGTASSAKQLKLAVKKEEFDRRGEPFTPDYVYDAIRRISRFSSMVRGHQQDAQEFLGFILNTLEDECVLSMDSGGPDSADASDSAMPTDGWQEVGRKQRAVVTRSLGYGVSTPISKIFSGSTRSELCVPGLADRVEIEHFQPLQLHIGSSDVNSLEDAIRAHTRPERIQGEFGSPRGSNLGATKQTLIESLPPVLIIHLKRFEFDAKLNEGVKIWKKIAYPHKLEIPREALSRQARLSVGPAGIPHYKLIGVIYHHGRNTSEGHYTSDVRRQDGEEWIRLDDLAIQRVRSEDVADATCAPNPTASQQSGAPGASGNRMSALNDQDTGDEGGWKQVAPAGAKKQWSSVVNGTANGFANGRAKEMHAEDGTIAAASRVAYLLFYQRI